MGSEELRGCGAWPGCCLKRGIACDMRVDGADDPCGFWSSRPTPVFAHASKVARQTSPAHLRCADHASPTFEPATGSYRFVDPEPIMVMSPRW
jgi:hypothetical protein